MRILALIAALLLPLSAFAQTAASPVTTPDAAKPAHQPPHQQTFKEHFDTANTTHDGHLTLEQAKTAKWVAVVRRFDKMDTEHKGYVTSQDIIDQFRRERTEKAKAIGTSTSNAAGSKS